MAAKAKKPEKPEEESSVKDLMKVIITQQEQIAKQGEDLKKLSTAHNKLVDLITEFAEGEGKKGKGKGKGSLADLAAVLTAVAPLLKGRESSPFEAIGVYTFKQFLRSTMGKKMSKKAMKAMAKDMGEEEKEE